MRDVIFLIVIVGQTSGLPVAKPPVSWLLGAGHPEDALTGRPEVLPHIRPTFAPHSFIPPGCVPEFSQDFFQTWLAMAATTHAIAHKFSWLASIPGASRLNGQLPGPLP